MFLSVIIPVYNTNVSFLQECLDSLELIELDENDFEILIVNDGSSLEETTNYLKNLILNFKNYVVINKSNGGVGSARNAGIKSAKGIYMFYLDSDDKIYDEFSIFLKTLKENPQIDVLFGNLKMFDESNEIIKYDEFNRLTLYFEENIIPNGSFFKKSAAVTINGNDESLKILEDYDFWMRLAFKGFYIVNINLCAYEYRKIYNGASLIQQNGPIISKYEKIIKAKNPFTKVYFLNCFVNSFRKTKKSNIFRLIFHYYKKQPLLDPALFNFFMNLHLDHFNKLAAVSEVDISRYLHSKFLHKKRRLIGLAIHLYAPKLYLQIVKYGGFSYGHRFI